MTTAKTVLNLVVALAVLAMIAGPLYGQAADAFVVGRGFPLPNSPTLSSTLPVIGQNVSLTADLLPPGESTWLVVSSNGANINLGGGAKVYVDLANVTFLGPFTTTASGNWTLTVPLSLGSSWAGVEFHMQLAALSPMGDIALTNGLHWTIGF